MATVRQALGERGEKLVVTTQRCPRCKHARGSLKQLRQNFKCADVICDFCGFLAQVKTTTVKGADLALPRSILGAAWGPQKERMDAGIYISLYLVAVNADDPRKVAVYFLPSELQTPAMFVERKALSATAKRAGWQGYLLDLTQSLGEPVRVG